MQVAIHEAEQGLEKNGLPIDSVLANSKDHIVDRGHNRRVQDNDPTAHAEIVYIRNAGCRRDWTNLTLVSTLSPCIMCTGTALLYKIPRIVIGENRNFQGAEDLFHARRVELIHLDNPRCIELMKYFIADNPDLWNQDIGEPSD